MPTVIALGRAITNLIENAVQAVEGVAEGAPRRITIATTPRRRCRDRHHGIRARASPDVLPQIFEPLFSTRSFGAGLGLAIVSQIIAQHGGKVGAESVLGEGTTVRCASRSPQRRRSPPRCVWFVLIVDKNIKRGRALLSTPQRSNDINRSMTLE